MKKVVLLCAVAVCLAACHCERRTTGTPCRKASCQAAATAHQNAQKEAAAKRAAAEKKAAAEKAVAEKMFMTQQQYSRFENGIFELNYEQLAFLCKLYDISADYLLGLSEY